MRAPIRVLVPMLAASALLTACGSSSSSSSSSSAQQSTTVQNAGASTGALVKTASNSKLGTTVLVNAHGLTLYHLSGEGNGKFICTSATCVQVWHPVIAVGTLPHSIGSLTTIKRPDGTMQVAYRGMPLYTFAHDTAPGQDNGQGIKDVGTWTAVSTGAAGSTSPAPASSSTTSGRYGY
jgi:predicted lipoprotein with Yx(FWY)xxD motif